MLFNSYIFIFVFFPICIFGYFLLNRANYKVGRAFLLLMSLWFYGYFNVKYLAIIISSVVINFGFYKIFQKVTVQNKRKITLYCAIIFNVGILFYFKYYDFFIENINLIFKSDIVLKGLLLPLGISFFTFQQLSFVIDAYRGEVEEYPFLDYALFVTFFPQLIAGPIVTHDELVPQLLDESRKKINWENVSSGLYIFALGLAKKVLVADVFGNAANWGFENVGILDTTNAVIAMLSYTIQIYFDFSGYCDMAIGIGKMMNIDLPVNFDSPYKSLTIVEFWKRWHKTLTRFLTKYIYIPLGGSRKGKIRTYINIMLVFLISGLWHGANYTFILWGFLHGLFQVITKHFKSLFERLHPAFNWLLTFSFLNVTWVFFRADSIGDAVGLLKCIVQLNFQSINSEVIECFNLPEFVFVQNHLGSLLGLNDIANTYPCLMLLIYFVAAFFILLGAKNAYEKMCEFKPNWINMLTTAVLLVWCVFSFSGISTFLYYNF